MSRRFGRWERTFIGGLSVRSSKSLALAILAVAVWVALAIGCGASQRCVSQPSHADTDAAWARRNPFWQEIPVAAFKFEMLSIPGDPSRDIKPFWISKTEITWEAFDVFVYRLDEQVAASEAAAQTGVDAVTRPTKPYLPPDRGFGHEGYAAITMSHKNAAAFCAWLSEKSGRHYRLPTEQEWEYACLSKDPVTIHDDFAWQGDDYGARDLQSLGEYAWFASNADGMPHPVSTKLPNLWGLCDMHGNVAEWVDGSDGRPVVKGGSYLDPAEKLKISARMPNDPAWNASDPQIPKSQWWLANAPFIGFRVVCDDGPGDKP